MTNFEHEQLKQVLHLDLAGILFGMVKSKKYSEYELRDMLSFIAVRFVNISKSESILVDSRDLEIILENTFDFAKKSSGGEVDSLTRESVTSKYYELLNLAPELIEKHIEDIFINVRPFIR